MLVCSFACVGLVPRGGSGVEPRTEQEILDRFGREVALPQQRTTLGDAVQLLGKALDLDLEIVPSALQQSGITRNQRVSLNGRKTRGADLMLQWMGQTGMCVALDPKRQTVLVTTEPWCRQEKLERLPIERVSSQLHLRLGREYFEQELDAAANRLTKFAQSVADLEQHLTDIQAEASWATLLAEVIAQRATPRSHAERRRIDRMRAATRKVVQWNGKPGDRKALLTLAEAIHELRGLQSDSDHADVANEQGRVKNAEIDLLMRQVDASLGALQRSLPQGDAQREQSIRYLIAVTMVMELIQGKPYGYEEEEDFVKLARDTSQYTESLADELRQGKNPPWRPVVQRLKTNCSRCHRDFR